MSGIIFEQYYRQVYQDLYRFALYTLGNPQDAEDAVSEAVTDAYQGFGGLKKQESFRPWMFKILTIKCKRKMKEYVNRPVELENAKAADHFLIRVWRIYQQGIGENGKNIGAIEGRSR